MLPSFKEKFTKVSANPTPAFPSRTSVLLPFVSIRLFNKDDQEKYIDLKAMLDSGAGLNIFPGEFGRGIGLSVINDRTEQIKGIGGQAFEGYVHDVILGVGGWKFNTYACFTFSEIACPVLGRDGFFNLFQIKIDYLKNDMDFKAKAEPIKT